MFCPKIKRKNKIRTDYNERNMDSSNEGIWFSSTCRVLRALMCSSTGAQASKSGGLWLH